MINYGADEIFKFGGNVEEMKDEDVEDCIKKGEEKALSMQKQADDIIKSKFNLIDFEVNSLSMY